MRYQLSVTSLAIVLTLSGCAGMSETQRDKTRDTAIGAGAIAGNVWSRRMEEQKKEMEQATTGTRVRILKTSDNRLKLDISSDISFDTGQAEIKSNFKPLLDSFATSLTSNPGTQVTIIGHTDGSGSDAVNEPLSLNRAAGTRDYLVSGGVSSNRLSVDGRGSLNLLLQTILPHIEQSIVVWRSL